ncbi:MAG: hypothetical protein Q4D38_10820 [Planctomycetia bacterium]|nr:hypothetical protein [Planctomycetia bacterium]
MCDSTFLSKKVLLLLALKSCALFVACVVWGVSFSNQSALGEEILVESRVDLASKILLSLPPRDGDFSIYLGASNEWDDAWTIVAPPYLTTQTSDAAGSKAPKIFPSNAPKDSRWGKRDADGIRLDFRLPPELCNVPTTLVVPSGIYSWGAPRGSWRVEVWSGLRLKPLVQYESGGRFFSIEIRHPDVASVEWEVPDFIPVQKTQNSTQNPTQNPMMIIGRMPRRACVVRAKVVAQNGETSVHSFELAPALVVPPFDPRKVVVGACFYGDDETLPLGETTEWEAPARSPRYTEAFYLEDFLKAPYAQLAVFWPAQKEVVQQRDEWIRLFATKNIYSMTIYQHQSKKRIQTLREISNEMFLGNNLGEYASYLYQGRAAAEACDVKQVGDMALARDGFVRDWMLRGTRRYHADYPLVSSTSGAAVADYELQGGVDFMLSELFAIGAQNLAYASSEMRGAARKWQPEFWGGWLAHEWQTCAIPYDAPQKWRLLEAALFQQYSMGASLIINESGAVSTQAGFYTRDSGKQNRTYHSETCRNYRDILRKFSDFVSENPRQSNSPEVRIAILRGNTDAFVGIRLGKQAVWSQFDAAERDPDWFYCEPEASWGVVKETFFPLPEDAVAPYSNAWLAASPFGQVDIVGLDDFLTLEDLRRYKLLIFAGWSAMTPRQFDLLTQYVEGGGVLLASPIHFSMRTDRRFRALRPADFPNNGSFAPLIDTKINENGHLEHDSTVEVLENGCLRQARGKGWVYLMQKVRFPGDSEVRDDYQKWMARLAQETRPPIVATGEPSRYLFYAVYSDYVDFLNVDLNRAHDFEVQIDGRPEKIALPPAGWTRKMREKAPAP